jgi:hypothetical protein
MSLETPNFPFETTDDKNKTQGRSEYDKYPRMLGDDFVVKEVRRGGMGEVYICSFAHGDDDTQGFKTLVHLGRKGSLEV